MTEMIAEIDGCYRMTGKVPYRLGMDSAWRRTVTFGQSPFRDPDATPVVVNGIAYEVAGLMFVEKDREWCWVTGSGTSMRRWLSDGGRENGPTSSAWGRFRDWAKTEATRIGERHSDRAGGWTGLEPAQQLHGARHRRPKKKQPVGETSMSETTSELSVLLDMVRAERGRQDVKWGTDFAGRDPNEWLAILDEEVGEVSTADELSRLVAELVQVAAVCLSWAEHAHAQGPTNQFPDGATLRLKTMQLGDDARALLETRGLG